MKTVLEVLTQARGLVKKGWCQKDYQKIIKGKVKYCPVGAVFEVDVNMDCVSEVFTLLLKVINKNNIADWNDKSKRTKTQVLHAFDKAIKLAKHANLQPTESQEG